MTTMTDLELRLRYAWNMLDAIAFDLFDAGHKDEAKVVSRTAATVRTLQSQMSAGGGAR